MLIAAGSIIYSATLGDNAFVGLNSIINKGVVIEVCFPLKFKSSMENFRSISESSPAKLSLPSLPAPFPLPPSQTIILLHSRYRSYKVLEP